MMKKLLLISSLTFAYISANAQTTIVTLYDGETPSSVPSAAGGTPYSHFPVVATGTSFSASSSGDGGNATTYISFTATIPNDGSYYLGGFGNGFYVENTSTSPPTYPSSPIPGVGALDPTTHRISVRLKDVSDGKLKFEFKQMSSGKLFSHEVTYTGSATWQTLTITLDQLHSNDHSPIAPTSSDVDAFGEFFVAFNCALDGCTKNALIDDIKIENFTTTGISSSNNELINFNVYPNPTNSSISIDFGTTNVSQNITILVSDLVGNNIFTQQLTQQLNKDNGTFKLNTDQLQNGNYIATILVDNKSTKSILFSIQR